MLLQTTWSYFVCQECHLPFDGSGFYELNGAMYCERHFLAHRGMPCVACGQPIKGRCVTAMYKKYHPEHFVCTFCLRPLNKGTFKEQNEKPYCHACFDKLFGWTLVMGSTFVANTQLLLSWFLYLLEFLASSLTVYPGAISLHRFLLCFTLWIQVLSVLMF